jgi:hypothetical protein
MVVCDPPTPMHDPARLAAMDEYVAALGLDALELEELLTAIDDRCDHGTRETRALLAPCRNAVVRELRAVLTPRH